MTLESPTLAQDATTPTDPTPSPHEALRTALRKSGLHYTDFAPCILGCSPSSVWRWMQGQKIPQTVQDRITYYLTQEQGGTNPEPQEPME
jgi:hypothetical protein